MQVSWILSKYISHVFSRWFLITLGIVIVIICLFDFSELLRRASTRPAVTFDLLLHMLVLKVPALLQEVLTFIVLFASIMTFWKLNRHHELDVTRAAGVSVWQLIFPMVLTALLIGAIDLGIVNPISAKMMLQYEHLEDRYFKGYQGSLAVSESGLWVREALEGEQRVLRIARIDNQNETLHNLSIYQVDDADRFFGRIDAKKGVFKEGKLRLESVWFSAPEELPQSHDRVDLPTTLSFIALQDTGADPSSLSFWDIPRFSALLEKSGLSSLKYRLHWHSLLARWLGLAVMVLLAACCSLRPIRQGGTIFLIIVGVGSAFILYFLRDMSYALGSSGTIPVLLAAWAPALVSSLIGITLLLHFEDG